MEGATRGITRRSWTVSFHGAVHRITFQDGSLLEMFERFQIVNGQLVVTKYRFHWQDAAGRLLKRWDNAAHHPQVSTHPHHVHDGREENVSSYEPLSAEEVLAMIASISADD